MSAAQRASILRFACALVTGLGIAGALHHWRFWPLLIIAGALPPAGQLTAWLIARHKS